MLADVSERRRAEHGVDDRVGQEHRHRSDTSSRALVGDLDAAEDQFPAVGEAVAVVAEPGGDQPHARQPNRTRPNRRPESRPRAPSPASGRTAISAIFQVRFGEVILMFFHVRPRRRARTPADLLGSATRRRWRWPASARMRRPAPARASPGGTPCGVCTAHSRERSSVRAARPELGIERRMGERRAVDLDQVRPRWSSRGQLRVG